MLGNLFDDDQDDSNVNNNGSSSVKRTYMKKPSDKRSPYGFVGLLNQGATCYLNSLIQMLYMTPELKNDIYKLTIDDFGITELKEKEEREKLEKEKKQVENELNNNNNNNSTTTTTTTSNNHNINNTNNTNNNNIYNNDNFIDDEELLKSEYAVSILSWGFEDFKVAQGLRKYPHEHQQEQLIDWILSYDSRSNNEIGSLLDDDMQDFMPNPSTFDDCYDAYYPSKSSSTPPIKDNSQAIVLYDENHINNITALVKDIDDNNNGDTTNTLIKENGTEMTTTTTTTDNNNSTTTTVTTTTNNSNKKKGRVIPYELQKLFALLQRGNVFALSTENLTKSFGWNSDESFHQQDIHELNRILFDAVEHSIKKTHIETLFNDLYKGSFINRLYCTECGYSKETQESFQDIPVSVKGFDSIEESLASMVEPEILDGANKYHCDKCDKKVKATFEVKLGKLPPIVIFALRRFDYDFQRQTRVKISSKFEFAQTLDLTEHTIDHLNHKNDPTKYPKPDQHKYELFAVLIHSGGAFGGHYHSYIKDVLSIGKSYGNNDNSEKDNNNNSTEQQQQEEKEKEKEDKEDKFNGWFDFNDSCVLPIKDSSLKKQFGGKDECAYMLIYRDVTLQDKVEFKDIPQHLEKELADFNASIENQRVSYEKTMNSFYVYPHFQDSVEYRDGLLYFVEKQLTPEQELESDGITLSLNSASTTSDLFAQITENYPEQYGKLLDKMVIQEMTIKDNVVTLSYPIASDNINVKKAGLREGAKILVWKGERKTNQPPLKLLIKHHKDEKNISSSTLIISKEATFTQLVEQLSKLCGIDCEKLEIYTSPNPSTLIQLEDDISNAQLSNRVYNGMTLMVQSKHADGVSFVDDYFQQNKNKIQVFVKTRLLITGDDKESVSVLVDPKSTVYQLKSIIFDTLHPTEKKEFINRSILRKTIVGGYDGNAITDDSLFLKEAGIEQFALVILEKGTPSKSILTLKYNVKKESTAQPLFTEPREIQSLKTTTILDLKKEIMTHLDISLELCGRYALRYSDLFEKPRNVISDEDQSLEEAGLTTMDVVWLEEGVAPSKDFIRLFISLYKPSTQKQLLPIPSSPLIHLSASYTNQIPGLYDIFKIGDLNVDKKQPLFQLRDQILRSKGFNNIYPGFERQYEDIRLWTNEKLLSTSSSNNKSLSTFHLQNDTIIFVEIYSKDSKLIDSNSTTTTASTTTVDNTPPILLYIHKRSPSEQCFEYPNQQILFKGRTYQDLLSQISIEFSIDEKNLKLFKYFNYNPINPWRILEDKSKDEKVISSEIKDNNNQNNSNNNNQNNNNNNNSKKKISSELRGKPYILKDGDVIAYLDITEDPENSDRFAMTVGNDFKSNHKPPNSPNGGPTSPSKKKVRAPERELKIQLDDF